MNRRQREHAFTLVELLVVIFIIGVLIVILVPAINAARTKARTTATQSELTALATGIEQFRGEAALGGVYPPSRSDNPQHYRKIANPRDTAKSNQAETEITGAHLLAFALVGADLLGPPGFKDVNNNGTWFDDMTAYPGASGDPAGLYGLDPNTGQAKWARYGSAGFVNDQAKSRIRSLKQLEEKGTISVMPSSLKEETRALPLFTDSWDVPILYYRANPSSRFMCGGVVNGQNCAGVYNQEDNGLITGTNGAQPGTYDCDGIDFGAGPLPDDSSGKLHHRIARASYPAALPTGSGGDLKAASFDNTFARFIWDKSITARNEPVLKDTYLLISAGPDLVYGTADDVTNWQRQE